MSRISPSRALPLLALTSLALAGCFGGGSKSLVPESFGSDNTFSRSFPQTPAQACEAARRTLLGQGYTISSASADSVQGTKNFQPNEDMHEQLLLRISCAPREPDGSLVFVNAVQDRYSLKKSPTSASVGVGMLGSVSMPIGSSNDSLVRVGSVTVQDAAFYTAFFDRLAQYLPRPKGESKPEPKPGADTAPQPPAAAPTPAPPATPAAAPSPDATGPSAPTT